MLGCAAITQVMPRMLLGPTMRVKEEKPNELRLDATRRRRSSWCKDGEIIEGALAIVLWTGATGSVTLVQERQFQHEVGQATAAAELVDHLNLMSPWGLTQEPTPPLPEQRPHLAGSFAIGEV